MNHYLYGARINGIQSYIFETGRLKEILGASEQVEQISAELKLFQQLVGETAYQEEEDLLLHAAGKIIYRFRDRSTCEQVVRAFPRAVAQVAPGIRVSQAVVKLPPNQLTAENLGELEARLDIQETQAARPVQSALMIAKRVSRTGGAAVHPSRRKSLSEEEELDEAQLNKQLASREARESLFRTILSEQQFDRLVEKKDNGKVKRTAFAADFSDLLATREQGWLAVIHADGNSLGKLIQGLLGQLDPSQVAAFYRTFSQTLGEATAAAVNTALEAVALPTYERERAAFERRKQQGKRARRPYLPLRPIILGGDDLTLVIRGELALRFCAEYLRSFEATTQAAFNELADAYALGDKEADFRQGLTACAGIAYIKYNFPFHYGVDLAGDLCDFAKKDAKALNERRPPSSLAFHRVQSSFVDSYGQVVKQELCTHPSSGEKVYLNYGPYFLHQEDIPVGHDYHDLATLLRQLDLINKQGYPRAPLREWLTELKISQESALQLLQRIQQLNPRQAEQLGIGKGANGLTGTRLHQVPGADGKKVEKAFAHTHLYDLISLSGIHSSS